MKRNTTFLMMLALAISIMAGVFLLSGCSDDETIVEPPPQQENDYVIGYIEGVVRSAYDNSPISDCWVLWMKADTSLPDLSTMNDSVKTNDHGFFIIADSLPSGDYIVLFRVGDDNSYVEETRTARIPSLQDLKGDIDASPAGPIEYYFSFGSGCAGDECEDVGPVVLWPDCSLVIRGRLFTSLLRSR
jgi:hypothetical protein